MRIGVFGGSFDPVHRGHVALAEEAVRALRLDEVRFVPARLQPLKAGGPRAGPDERLAMLAAATAGAARFVVDPRELRRPGPSFTVDTLRELRAERPGDELFLLLGADAAAELPRWREAGEVARLARIVVASRPGVPPALPPGAVSLAMAPTDISASDVRETAARGGALDHLVPEGVAAYIAGHRLYRTDA